MGSDKYCTVISLDKIIIIMIIMIIIMIFVVDLHDKFQNQGGCKS